MTFQQLRCLVAAAKYQSFHRAVEHLFITQPSVTHQIQQLERELGTQLFDRSQRKTVLTEAGRLFYEDTVGILDRLDLAVQRVRQASDKGSLIIICEEMANLEELSKALKVFHRKMPQVLLNLTEEDRPGVRDAINKRIADVTIAPLAAVRDLQDVSYVLLGRGRQRCIMQAGHPMSERDVLTLGDLAGQTLIIPDTYHCPPEQRHFYRTLQEQVPQVRFCYAGTSRQAVDMVRAGLGMAVFPEYALPEIPDLVVADVECRDSADLVAAWHTGSDRAAVRCFVEILKEIMGEMG